MPHADPAGEWSAMPLALGGEFRCAAPVGLGRSQRPSCSSATSPRRLSRTRSSQGAAASSTGRFDVHGTRPASRRFDLVSLAALVTRRNGTVAGARLDLIIIASDLYLPPTAESCCAAPKRPTPY